MMLRNGKLVMYLNDCSSMEHQTIARNQSDIHICRCLCYHIVSALRGCVILADLQVLELHNHSRVAYFRSHHWVVNRSVLHWVNYCTILNQSSSCRSPYVPYLYEIRHLCIMYACMMACVGSLFNVQVPLYGKNELRFWFHIKFRDIQGYYI